MGELKHCPSCNDFFNYTGIREVCNKCALDEEKLYEKSIDSYANVKIEQQQSSELWK